MRAQYATKAYSVEDVSGKTAGRTPEELIVLLFDKACSSLKTACLTRIEQKDDMDLTNRLAAIENFHKSTSKAMQIVVALREMLDMERGGAMATQLAETYTIIAQNIWTAAKEENTAALSKLVEALSELREAWRTIASS
jgi:flagellar biosynthetic protein FliS